MSSAVTRTMNDADLAIMQNGCRKEGLILNPTTQTFQRMCSKKEGYFYFGILLPYKKVHDKT